MECVQETYSDPMQKIEDLMRSQINEYNPVMARAIDSILLSGGKRIRPKIVILIGRLVNANDEKLSWVASAIELLHTATLIHDDLIDTSLFRRGTPTLNSKWSSSATVLTGDFLFAAASDLASRTNSVEVMRLFSRTLMTIVNGEINQLFSKRLNLGINEYYNRIYAKTASLFETSSVAPAMISNVNKRNLSILREFGKELGIAFQIYDDILDYVGNEKSIGKPVGSDLRQRLATLPLILFIKTNPKDSLVQKILTNECDLSEEEIQYLLKIIPKSEVIQFAQKEALECTARAEACILNFPDKPERDELIRICRSIIR